MQPKVHIDILAIGAFIALFLGVGVVLLVWPRRVREFNLYLMSGARGPAKIGLKILRSVNPSLSDWCLRITGIVSLMAAALLIVSLLRSIL
jgi:hypothetical protein